MLKIAGGHLFVGLTQLGEMPGAVQQLDFVGDGVYYQGEQVATRREIEAALATQKELASLVAAVTCKR